MDRIVRPTPRPPLAPPPLQAGHGHLRCPRPCPQPGGCRADGRALQEAAGGAPGTPCPPATETHAQTCRRRFPGPPKEAAGVYVPHLARCFDSQPPAHLTELRPTKAKRPFAVQIHKYYCALSDRRPSRKQGTVRGDMVQGRRWVAQCIVLGMGGTAPKTCTRRRIHPCTRSCAVTHAHTRVQRELVAASHAGQPGGHAL
jgi:hypothetical protein